MDNLDIIFSRKSVREYTNKEVSKEDILTILKAGQQGPSAVNTRDWQFIVITKKDKLHEVSELLGRQAKPLDKAQFGILVIADYDLAFAGETGYSIIDGALACENMILAANGLGIGSVYLGVYPRLERVNKLTEYFNLPKNKVPHSLIAFGYDALNLKPKGVFEEDKIHYNEW